MQECQITTALVHTLIEKGRPSQTPESRPKINLPMQYEQYNPTSDVHARIRSQSFYETKNKPIFRLDKRKAVRFQSSSKKQEPDNMNYFPNKVAVQFQVSKSKSKKLQKSQRPNECLDYNTLIVQSMQKYISKVEKDKIRKRQKCEKVRGYGLNIQAINCDDFKQKQIQKKKMEDLLKIQRQKLAKQKSVTLPFNSTMYNSIPAQSSNEHNPNQKCRTEKSEQLINGIDKNQTKKFNIRVQRREKEDERSITNKMSRNLNFFCVFLSSFGVFQKNQTLLKKKMKKFTFYIGKGNNKNLIVSILKKRWWWTEAESLSSADFVWTQLKISSVLQKQVSMNYSSLQEVQVDKYKKIQTNSISKLQKALISTKPFMNIFHTDHSQKFHQKLKESQEKALLRQIKVPLVLHNHYQANYMVGNKKALFKNIQEYSQYFKKDPFQFMPLTFHIDKVNSKVFKLFEKRMQENKNECWIVKPGQNSNRGQGIFVSDSFGKIKRKIEKSKKHTYIIQKYLKNVFLFQRRKFDIRTYLLLLSIGGVKKFYWYSQGYLRTCSQVYDLSDLDDPYIHLTNDAIQVDGSHYSKYEKGNKITYYEFQRYLDINFPNEKYSLKTLNNKMKKIAKQVVQATYFKLDPCRKQCNFELFGMDFIIDSSFKPWLLEVNTNPCLSLSSPVLQRLVPRMVENLFRIVIDPLFQPKFIEPSRTLSCYIPENIIDNNRFELIFDSMFDSLPEWQRHCAQKGNEEVYEDEDEQFDNDGELINITD